MTHKRAAYLADQIAAFWKRRGHVVKAWVEKEPWSEKAQTSGYTVRTDLVNGLPRTATPKTVADLAARPAL